VSFTNEEIIQINKEFKKLKDAYCREEDLKNSLDRLNYKLSFADGWNMLVDRFPLLCQFMGGLASVFPGTSREKNDYRTSLTNFSLEGILHCKQYDDLKALSQRLQL
jgi:hypothetical protein